MYSLKVIAHSASGKSILASVSKKSGMFVSEVATGAIKIDNPESIPSVGSVHLLEGITKVSTRTSISDDAKEFVWLVLE